jgi:hypothetical protein
MQLALSAEKITINASVLRLSICIRSALTNLLGDGKCRVTIKRHQYIPQNAAAFGVMRIRSFHSDALPALRLDSLEPVVYSSLRMAASWQALPDGHCPEVNRSETDFLLQTRNSARQARDRRHPASHDPEAVRRQWQLWRIRNLSPYAPVRIDVD